MNFSVRDYAPPRFLGRACLRTRALISRPAGRARSVGFMRRLSLGAGTAHGAATAGICRIIGFRFGSYALVGSRRAPALNCLTAATPCLLSDFERVIIVGVSEVLWEEV